MTKLLVILWSMSFQLVQVFVQCDVRVPYPLRSSRSTVQSFIVGGTPAAIEEFPHHLALLESGNYICGASVIADKWAMSAGMKKS